MNIAYTLREINLGICSSKSVEVVVPFYEGYQDDTSTERSKMHTVSHIYPGGESFILIIYSDHPDLGIRNRFEGANNSRRLGSDQRDHYSG